MILLLIIRVASLASSYNSLIPLVILYHNGLLISFTLIYGEMFLSCQKGVILIMSYLLMITTWTWFESFSSVVTDAGFKPSDHDPALFVHTSSRGRTLLLYVDDMIIIGDVSQFIDFVKKRLSDKFLMFDLGPLRYFLGFEISSTPDGTFMILCRAALTDHNTIETPMEHFLGGGGNTPLEIGVQLRATDGEPLADLTRYLHLVGSLIYLGITRPNILIPFIS